MFLGAANRDPRRWENPGSYEITRRTSGHVGYGSGIHMCVGQLVARLEGEVMMAALGAQGRIDRDHWAGEASIQQYAARAQEFAGNDHTGLTISLTSGLDGLVQRMTGSCPSLNHNRP